MGLGVEVGNHHLNKPDPDQKSIAVSKVSLHEDYDSWTVYNDICTLDLAEEADLSSDVIDVIALRGERGVRGRHRVYRVWLGHHLLRGQPPRSCRRSPSLWWTMRPVARRTARKKSRTP